MNVFVITRINLYRLYFLLGLIIGYVVNYPLIRIRFVVYTVFPATGVFKYARMENTVYVTSLTVRHHTCVTFVSDLINSESYFVLFWLLSLLCLCHFGVRFNCQNRRMQKAVVFMYYLIHFGILYRQD
jgi:hypothetical protein